ncbi:MAG: UDP-N-acetylmuramoyl-L-alanine--D-glutamate ligase [Candidatus Paceibacterota bacterium]|jgi:UDP-N-acetylmuramoylalanine--D-glutamate ligase
MEKRAAIIGFGREGKSILKFLKKYPRFKNYKIEILDKKDGENYLDNLERFEVIFRSPGVPYNLPQLRAARKAGVEFSSATKLFFENYNGKIIGVTGTKGKGTTSTLIYEILKAGGLRVFLAGNIGKSALDFLADQKKYQLAILELSSFQLQDLEASPEIAVVLDIFPDHQDSHSNLKEYYTAKANMGKFQKRSDKIFFFADNQNSRKLASESPAVKFAVDYKKFNLVKQSEMRIRGFHNFKNAAMAEAVASQFRIPKEIVIEVIKKFTGLKHRLEFIKEIKISENKILRFYDDSASTNPQTSAAAIKAFPSEGKILIAGGQDKNLDYAPLNQALRKEKIGAVILLGENKNKILTAVKSAGVKTLMTDNLEAALQESIKEAKKDETKKIQNIIFSPGAASFDMFKNYADRGDKFKQAVAGITKLIKQT